MIAVVTKEEIMEKPVLTDKNVFPSDEVIFSHIGKNKKYWTALFEDIKTGCSDIACEWRYYNDGKSWLMKAVRGSKTVFWLSIVPGTFRTTFYFSAKFKALIAKSGISEDLKKQFTDKVKTHKFPGITVIVGKNNDIENVKKLIELKKSAK